jgi:alpha-mannosidase
VVVVGDATRTSVAAPDAASFSFATASAPNVTLETVKKAEKSDHLIVRLFEHANQRAETTVTFGVPIKSVALVNLMEEGDEAVPLDGTAVTLSLRPFEIATLKIELA